MTARIEVMGQEQFWEAISRKARERRVPVEAMVELTYGCNLRCVHCYNPTHRARGELDTGAFCRLIDELADVGCLHIAFTGGEALTRRDCLEIVRHARGKGFQVSLLTNATLVTAEVADRLESLAPRRVEVSVYGATAATYERVTGVPGSHARFVQGVHLLRQRRLPLLLKMPVMTLNAGELAQVRELATRWGVELVISTEIFPRVDGSLEPLRYRLTPEQVVRVHEEVAGSVQMHAGGGEPQEQCGGTPGTLFTCRCGTTSLALTPYGQMNLCVSLPIPRYDLMAGTVADGWRRLEALVEQANASPGPAYECPSCSLREECRQGPMNAWLETGNLSPCLPYFKELARLERRTAGGAQAPES